MPNSGGAPGAPADPATPPTPGAPAPAPTGTPTPQPGQDPNAPVDVASLPVNVQNLIASVRSEAASHRQGKTAAEQAAAEAKSQRDAVLKALGINADGTRAQDPAAAAAELTQRATDAENAAWGASVRLEVFQRAGKLGADANALLDSMTFVDSLDELTDAPGTPAFGTALEAKIAEAIGRNANLRATPAAPGRSGGDFPGGSGANQAITEEQLAAMSPGEIAEAYAKGRLKHLM